MMNDNSSPVTPEFKPSYFRDDSLFCEQLVTRRLDKEIIIRKILCLLLTSLAFVLSLYIPGIDKYWYIPLLGFAFLGATLWTYQNMEYEYQLTNCDLDITAIYARRKRKELLSVDCRDFHQLSPMKSKYKSIWSSKQNVIYFAASHINSKERWFAIFNNKDGRRSILIFEPNEEMMEIFRRFIPDKIKE